MRSFVATAAAIGLLFLSARAEGGEPLAGGAAGRVLLPREEVSLTSMHRTVIWQSGEEETKCFRIPLLTKVRGRILAFSEARRKTCYDFGSKSLVMKVSTNGGRSWGDEQVILSDAVDVTDGFNLGSVVTDEFTGRTFLVYVLCAHYIGCDTSFTMLIYSDDGGASWSHPRNLSKDIGTKMFSPGPGVGIQGRLLVCGHGTIEENGVFCLISDDHGDSWILQNKVVSIPFSHPKYLGDFDPDENQVAELGDGTLMATIRNQHFYHCRCRLFVGSVDGGHHFPLEGLRIVPELQDPACSAGLTAWNSTLFLSSVNDPKQRKNVFIRWSNDGGITWSEGTPVQEGPGSYSVLLYDPLTNSLLVAVETGSKDPNEFIEFLSYSVYWSTAQDG